MMPSFIAESIASMQTKHSFSFIIFFIALVLVLAGAAACTPQKQDIARLMELKNVDTITTASGLQYADITVGTGAEPKAGSRVTVHYTGTLENGTKFDSSVDRGQPFAFTIGIGQVIAGWDEGVMSMKVGGKRRLIIPSNLGYGARGAGNAIPPNATLLFDVELLRVD
jgi:peptidylprolyl isomerase